MDRDPSPGAGGCGGEGSGEEIPDEFICCVCLELLYKPIVLQCGHVLCFWCVKKSMDGRRSSRCPICRNVYNHFPSLCRALHFLLMKLYPITYHQREERISREERRRGYFSPQFGSVEESQSNKLTEQEQGGKYPGDEDTLEPKITEASRDTTSGQKHIEELEAASETGEHTSQNKLEATYNVVKPADLLCSACNELLFQPVVLNCGDVLCQACTVNFVDENGRLKCQICESTIPNGCPKVCLVLNQFLKENFPEEYSSRRDVLANQEPKTITNFSIKQNADERGSTSASGSNQLLIHTGVGCDSCGVFPIIGKRYKCKDCEDKIGYDLCGDCCRSGSKLTGRFNQRHSKYHRLELVDMPWRAMRRTTGTLEHAASSMEHASSTIALYLHRLQNQNGTGPDDHPNVDTSSD